MVAAFDCLRLRLVLPVVPIKGKKEEEEEGRMVISVDKELF